jgi:hypothetical protein
LIIFLEKISNEKLLWNNFGRSKTKKEISG